MVACWMLQVGGVKDLKRRNSLWWGLGDMTLARTQQLRLRPALGLLPFRRDE